MNLIQAIILGIIQGITEWLPISSSGHLVIAQQLFGIKQPLVFDVLLHFGSLLVIFLVFRKDILDIFNGLLKRDKKTIDYSLKLIIATIPIGLVGLFLKSIIEPFFSDIKAVGIFLIFTAIVLYLPTKINLNKSLDRKNSLVIGIAQSLAILPGVSRSGTTISTAMLLGIKREDAAKFSFLLAIPAILGATVLEAKNISQIDNISNLIIATITTIITGYFSLKLLLKIIKDNKFSYFSVYCLVVGVLILFFA